MKLSIHTIITGKPPKGDPIYTTLGGNWENIDVSWEDAFELITVDGCATSAELTGHNRSEENFVSRELIMIDIDSGMTIVDLLNDDFYNEFGAGFYASPSYTDELPKFRIMFRAESVITSAETYRQITRALLEVYKSGDVACKDASRLFFGTINCIIKEKTNKLLSNKMIADLIMLDTMRQAELPVHEHIEYSPINDAKKAKIISILCSHPIVDYNEWKSIGWGLKQGGFTLADFIQVTQCSKQDRDSKEAQVIWNDYKEGKVTMGSVIHICKTNAGANCFDELKSTSDIIKELRASQIKRTNTIKAGAY